MCSSWSRNLVRRVVLCTKKDGDCCWLLGVWGLVGYSSSSGGSSMEVFELSGKWILSVKLVSNLIIRGIDSRGEVGLCSSNSWLEFVKLVWLVFELLGLWSCLGVDFSRSLELSL
ncbi:hypothetical protein Droror1_Dr00021350 [Drosera rotundifolia]